MESVPFNCSEEFAQLVANPGNLSDLFSKHSPRLLRMVKLRMDPRVRGRLDPADVLQDAYLELAQQLNDYVRDPKLPLFLWLRLVTGQQLAIAHRKHLQVKARDASRDVSIFDLGVPQASSAAIAARLMGKSPTPGEAAARLELRTRIREALNKLDEIDREVLVLRHFEHLGNNESALALGLSPTAASGRYMRALDRLRVIIESAGGGIAK